MCQTSGGGGAQTATAADTATDPSSSRGGAASLQPAPTSKPQPQAVGEADSRPATEDGDKVLLIVHTPRRTVAITSAEVAPLHIALYT